MKIVTIVWILLAVLCGGYGILIRAIGSGTGFFLVWIALAVIFVGCSAAAQAGLWGIMPQFLRRVTLVLLCLILVLFTGIGGCIGSKMNTEGKPGLDYIIVLGAQIYERGPSAVLRFRLDKAVEYLNENPRTKCIVSGGKGSNEPCSEAEGMEKYLIRQGIPEERILKEKKSTTTAENIQYSKKFIKSKESVGIVTNNFHMFRALQIAKRQGLEDPSGIAAESTALYLPNNVLREILAEIKYLIF